MANGEATYPIRITFDSPGACPPIFVAGSFSVPEWQLYELEYSAVERKGVETNDEPRYTFSRTFEVTVGTFQYKFRLGHQGEWWVCNSNEEIVTDALGNQNNRLVVAPGLQKSGHTHADVESANGEVSFSKPKEEGKAVRSTDQNGSEGKLRRRRDQRESSSAALSTESVKTTIPPSPPVESLLQGILRWLKSILAFLFRRKAT